MYSDAVIYEGHKGCGEVQGPTGIYHSYGGQPTETTALATPPAALLFSQPSPEMDKLGQLSDTWECSGWSSVGYLLLSSKLLNWWIEQVMLLACNPCLAPFGGLDFPGWQYLVSIRQFQDGYLQWKFENLQSGALSVHSNSFISCGKQCKCYLMESHLKIGLCDWKRPSYILRSGCELQPWSGVCLCHNLSVNSLWNHLKKSAGWNMQCYVVKRKEVIWQISNATWCQMLSGGSKMLFKI